MKIRPEASPLFRLSILGLGLCAALGGIFIYLLQGRFLHMVSCPFRTLTGVPCPTCGSAHAMVALLQGHPRSALRYNPLTMAALGAAGAAFLWAVVASLRPGWRMLPRMSARDKRLLAGLLVIAILANWFYEVWRLI